jgi:hypothetical protein
MNVRFLDFIRAVGDVQASPGDKGCVVAAGVALGISKHLPLSSAPDTSPINYYNFTNLQAAKDFVALFNEQVVFDVKEALEETREFWMLRYNAAHPAEYPVYDMAIGFYDNLLGVAKWVDQESHSFNNLYKGEILALSQIVSQTIGALQAALGNV